FPMTEAADAGPAEAWLLKSLIKQREGFMSRHFERKISLAITRRLAVTRVTPDVMTVVSVAIGLVSAAFFLSSSPAYQLAGALLFLAHSILDGCDGELARLKFMESPHGAILDFWGDNVVHVGVFACMAIGLSHAQDATWPLALGAITSVATLGAAATQSRAFMLDTTVGADAAWIARFAEAFSHRDFIYLVIALAAFGKAYVFLMLASVGTPIFFLLLLWVGARRRAWARGGRIRRRPSPWASPVRAGGCDRRRALRADAVAPRASGGRAGPRAPGEEPRADGRRSGGRRRRTAAFPGRPALRPGRRRLGLADRRVRADELLSRRHRADPVLRRTRDRVRGSRETAGSARLVDRAGPPD